MLRGVEEAAEVGVETATDAATETATETEVSVLNSISLAGTWLEIVC